MGMTRFSPKAIAITLATAFALAAPAFAQETPDTQPPSRDQRYEDLRSQIENLDPASDIDVTGDELPIFFQKAVQGCTTDGYIYRMPYNLGINFDDLGAPSADNTPDAEKSVFGRLTEPDADSILGVSGTDDFVETLKAMTSTIHESMQEVASHLIDEAPANVVTSPIFNELAAVAVDEVETEFKERYGVTINITVEAPKEQGGRCGVVPPVQLPRP